MILGMCILSGCGVETATTAATATAVKAKELEEGKKTQEQARQKVEQAMEQSAQRPRQGDDETSR